LIYIRLILVAMFWSGTVIAIRVGSQTFGPFWGATLRYATAVVGFLPIVIRSGPSFFRMSRKEWLQVTVLGLTGVFAYNYLSFRGLKMVQASHAALIFAVNPILVMVFSSWMHGDPITRRRLWGALLSLTGVVIVISRGRLGQLFSGFEMGDLFILCATFSWMLYTLFGRTALKTITPLQASFWASVTGGALLLLMALGEPWPAVIPPSAIYSVLYLGLIGTVVGFVWFYDGVKKLGATRATLFNNMIPVFTLVLSILILKEKVSGYTYVGAALVTAGVLLAQTPGGKWFSRKGDA
jgi:drug/metabolite transporter (DMT)-like permease